MITETVVCPVCRGENEGLCIRCEGRGVVELAEGDARAVLLAVRAHPMLVATEGDEEMSGSEAINALCEIRAALDAAGCAPSRKAPRLGDPAAATVEAAIAFVEHVRGLRLDNDHEAADGATARLYAWALDVVLCRAHDARAIVAVARGV